MGVRIPQNQTITNKYTSGGEYMIADTQNEYKGYYYELNNRTYAGENFDTNNPEIVKINLNNYNKLLGNPNTYAYGVVSGVKIPNNNKITSIPTSINPNLVDVGTKFYCQKVNQNPIVIKEIDEDTYKSLQTNPLYKTTYVGKYNGKYQSVDDAEKQIPGITTFLGL